MKALLILGLSLATTLGDNWTSFRGGSAQGAATAPQIPAALDPAKATWKTDLPGGGVSSPVVFGERIFVTAELTESGHRALLCFDLATGRELWRDVDTFEAHGQHRFNSFASSTPTVDQDHVYLAWTSGGQMRALALTHAGKRVWSRDVGAYREDHGSGASPVIAGGHLIVACDSEGQAGHICGLALSDGAIRWKTPRASMKTPFSTPLLARDLVIFSSNPAALTAIDPKTGKIAWEIANPKDGLRAVSSPALVGDVVFASIGKGGRAEASIAVKLCDGTPATIWEGKKGIPYVPSPLAMGENFCFLSDGGILSSVRASDGEPVYSERVFTDQAYSSPVSSGNHVYCIARSGKVTTVKASAASFEIAATSDLGAPCDATPALTANRLIVRTSKELLCFGGPITP
jgi:outer membrane protein assembly factor BamB